MSVRLSSFYISINIFVFAVTCGLFACRSINRDKYAFNKEYMRLLEMNKEKNPVMAGEETSYEVPEMTAEEYERLADQYIINGKTGLAFMKYYKALSMDQNQNGLRYKIGLLLLKKGLAQDALGVFEEMLKNDPESALAYEGKGRVFLANRELDKAIENFEQAVLLEPFLWQAYVGLGLIYDFKRQFDIAICEYKKALAIKPDSCALFNNLGISYYMKGDYEESLKALTRASRTKPVNPKIYNNLGLVLYKLERYEDAFKAFEKGTTDKAAAYNNIGYMHLINKKYREAIHAFKKAIESKPSYYIKANENLKKAEGSLL